MTKMRTTYLGNLRTEILHEQSGNKIITDAPLDNHGKGEHFGSVLRLQHRRDYSRD